MTDQTPSNLTQPLTPRQIKNRDALMDAAEALFASYGYHAVSVREITGLAKVRVAEVNDLFGGKENLFYEVIRRRATVVNEQREQRLAAVDKQQPREDQVRALVAAFFDPLLEVSAVNDGWRNYLRLVNQMVGSRSPILLNVVEFYNPISQKFLMAIYQIYPEIGMPRILRHWQFILATYFSIFADNYRVNSLSQGKVQSSQFKEAYEEATTFIEFGLESLLSGSESK